MYKTTGHWSIRSWCICAYIACCGRKREYLSNGCELGRHTLGLSRYDRKLSIGTLFARFCRDFAFWARPPRPNFPLERFFSLQREEHFQAMEEF
jgi:hypothetical protein